MYTDNILRDIRDMIYLNNTNLENVHKTKRDAERHDDLADALYGLDQAMDAMCMIYERLKQLVDVIEMEALSHKVQSKVKSLSDLFDEEEAKK